MDFRSEFRLHFQHAFEETYIVNPQSLQPQVERADAALRGKWFYLKGFFGVNEQDDFLGYTEKRSDFVNWLFICLRVLSLPFKCIISVIRLLTECIPNAGYLFCRAAARKIRDLPSPLNVLPWLLLVSTAIAFKAWHFIGRSITSPIDGVFAAYREGYQFGGPEGWLQESPLDKNYKIAGKIFGCCAALVSLSVSIAFYGLKLPVTVLVISNYLSMHFIPFVQAHLSIHLANWLESGIKAIDALFEHVSPVALAATIGMGLSVMGVLLHALNLYRQARQLKEAVNESTVIPESTPTVRLQFAPRLINEHSRILKSEQTSFIPLLQKGKPIYLKRSLRVGLFMPSAVLSVQQPTALGEKSIPCRRSLSSMF